MSKEIKTIYKCDLCGKETITASITYPVIFHTEQTEGRSVKPYISKQNLDVCNDCCDKICMIDANGAQGHNFYTIKGN